MRDLWFAIKAWFMIYIQEPFVSTVSKAWHWMNRPCCDKPDVKVISGFGFVYISCKNCKMTRPYPIIWG